VLKNALEAVERRMSAESRTIGARIEFDVDWDLFPGPVAGTSHAPTPATE